MFLSCIYVNPKKKFVGVKRLSRTEDLMGQVRLTTANQHCFALHPADGVIKGVD